MSRTTFACAKVSLGKKRTDGLNAGSEGLNTRSHGLNTGSDGLNAGSDGLKCRTCSWLYAGLVAGSGAGRSVFLQ